MPRKKKASLTLDVISDPIDLKIADGTIEMRADADGLYSKDATGIVRRMMSETDKFKLDNLNYSDIAYTGQLPSTADDCDTYKTTGIWNVPNAAAIANTPNKGRGGILLCYKRGNYSTSSVAQIYYEVYGGDNPCVIYARTYNGTAATWGAWERIIKSTDLASTTTAGLMSATDKAKLDELGTGGTSSGTTAVKMDDIATIGTTSKTLAVEASRQYWQTIAANTGSVTLKLTLDGTQLAEGNAAEIVLRWPNSGAYIGTIEIILNSVTVCSFTINQGTPSAVVKVAKLGGEIVTSYIK